MLTDRSWRVNIKAYSFLLPALCLIFIFRIAPIINVIGQSFMRSDYITRAKIFVGIKNYMDLFTDRSFWNSVWVTIKLNLIINPFQIAISVIMALLISQKFRGRLFYRALFFIPLGVSLPVTTIYFSIVFRPGGVMNFILNALDIPIQNFLNSPQWALWIVIIIASWKGCSFWMIFIIAGLQNIPDDIYEASRLEGAGPFRTFFSLTLPLLSKTILFVLVTDTAANFMMFIPVFMLTRGGPDNSTNVLMYEAYKTTFMQGDMGHGMAMVAFLLAMLICVLIFQFIFLRDKD